MPTPILQVQLNGGAPATGPLVGNLSDDVQLSLQSTTGVGSARWEIFGHPPDMECPSGWSEDVSSGVFYYDGITPPEFAITHWGKVLLRVRVNASATDYDESTAITVQSANGLWDIGALEGAQFGGVYLRWVYDLQRNLRTLEEFMVSGGGGGGGGPVAMGGDCSGNSDACTVVAIRGVTVTAPTGSEATGNVLQVNGSNLVLAPLPLGAAGATSGTLAQSKVANGGGGNAYVWLSASGTNTFGALTDAYVAADANIAASKLAPAGSPNSVLSSDGSTNAWTQTPCLVRLDIADSTNVPHHAIERISDTELAVGHGDWATLRTVVGSSATWRLAGDAYDFLELRKHSDHGARWQFNADLYDGGEFSFAASRSSAGAGGGWLFKTQNATSGGIGGDFTVIVGSGTGYGRCIFKTVDSTTICAFTRETSGDLSRVGIGTASPTCALDVTGSAKFTGSVTATSLQPTAGYLHNMGTWSKAAGAGGTLTLGGAEAAGMCVEVTGAPGADVTLSFPTTSGAIAVIRNAMTNSARLTVSANSTSIDIGRGQTKLVYYDGSSLRSNDERLLVFEAELSLVQAGAGTYDTTFCKLPARCMVQEVYLRGSEAVAGGTSTLSLGVSGSYAQLLAAKAAPAVDAVTGEGAGDLGSDMSTNGQKFYSAAQTVTLRNVVAGSATTAGKVVVLLIAKVLP